YSPDKSRDTLFISNYATLEITDAVTRVDGVGSLIVFGSRDYAMRIWLDPDRLQSVGLTAGDVVTALQGQNVQVASGVLNQPPMDKPGAFQISVQTQGRLERAFDCKIDREYDGGSLQAVPAGPEIHHRLQPDAVHPAIGRCRRIDHRRSDHPGRAGGHPVPANLARRGDPDRRHS